MMARMRNVSDQLNIILGLLLEVDCMRGGLTGGVLNGIARALHVPAHALHRVAGREESGEKQAGSGGEQRNTKPRRHGGSAPEVVDEYGIHG